MSYVQFLWLKKNLYMVILLKYVISFSAWKYSCLTTPNLKLANMFHLSLFLSPNKYAVPLKPKVTILCLKSFWANIMSFVCTLSTVPFIFTTTHSTIPIWWSFDHNRASKTLIFLMFCCLWGLMYSLPSSSMANHWNHTPLHIYLLLYLFVIDYLLSENTNLVKSNSQLVWSFFSLAEENYIIIKTVVLTLLYSMNQKWSFNASFHTKCTECV